MMVRKRGDLGLALFMAVLFLGIFLFFVTNSGSSLTGAAVSSQPIAVNESIENSSNVSEMNGSLSPSSGASLGALSVESTSNDSGAVSGSASGEGSVGAQVTYVITGTIYYDANGNGVYDAGAPVDENLSGITVRIWNDTDNSGGWSEADEIFLSSSGTQFVIYSAPTYFATVGGPPQAPVNFTVEVTNNAGGALYQYKNTSSMRVFVEDIGIDGRTSGFANFTFAPINQSQAIVNYSLKITNGSNGFSDETISNYSDFGYEVESIGDLDGDGVQDVAVTSPFSPDPQLFILFLYENGTVKSSTKTFASEISATISSDFFGGALTSIGDINYDGINELVIGAHADEVVNPSEGVIYLLYLNSSGSVVNNTTIGNGVGGFQPSALDASDSFGSGMSGIGDLDGDGINDLAVGAIYDEASGSGGGGAVYILFMHANGTVNSSVKIAEGLNGFTGPITGTGLFGNSIANLGDLDGDSIQDFAVGASFDGNGDVEGAVYILFMHRNGSVKGELKITDGLGGLPVGSVGTNYRFGQAIEPIGDLNGDGVVDIIVGAPGGEYLDANEGSFYLLYLNSSGYVIDYSFITDKLWSFSPDGLNGSNLLGSSIANLGDLNFDGNPDLVIGANDDDLGSGTESGAIYVIGLQNEISSCMNVSGSSLYFYNNFTADSTDTCFTPITDYTNFYGQESVLTGPGSGVAFNLSGLTGLTISNFSSVSNFTNIAQIYHTTSSNINITDSYFSSNSSLGNEPLFDIQNSSDIYFARNQFNATGNVTYPIYFDLVDNLTLFNNNFTTQNFTSIFSPTSASGSTRINVSSNTFTHLPNNSFFGASNLGYDILMYYANHTTIYSNTFVDTVGRGGISLSYGVNATVAQNNFTRSEVYEVFGRIFSFYIMNDSLFYNNTLTSYTTNPVSGVEPGISAIGGSYRINVSSNTIYTRKRLAYGIEFQDTQDSVIEDNSVDSKATGIYLSTGNYDNNISENNVDSTYGIQVGSGTTEINANNTFRNNVVTTNTTYYRDSRSEIPTGKIDVNYLEFENDYGRLKWLNESGLLPDMNISGSGTFGLGYNLNISSGEIIFDLSNIFDTNVTDGLVNYSTNQVNDSANLSFYNLGDFGGSPDIFLNGENCTQCGTIYTIETDGTLYNYSVEVPHFSTYCLGNESSCDYTPPSEDSPNNGGGGGSGSGSSSSTTDDTSSESSDTAGTTSSENSSLSNETFEEIATADEIERALLDGDLEISTLAIPGVVSSTSTVRVTVVNHLSKTVVLDPKILLKVGTSDLDAELAKKISEYFGIVDQERINMMVRRSKLLDENDVTLLSSKESSIFGLPFKSSNLKPVFGAGISYSSNVITGALLDITLEDEYQIITKAGESKEFDVSSLSGISLKGTEAEILFLVGNSEVSKQNFFVSGAKDISISIDEVASGEFDLYVVLPKLSESPEDVDYTVEIDLRRKSLVKKAPVVPIKFLLFKEAGQVMSEHIVPFAEAYGPIAIAKNEEHILSQKILYEPGLYPPEFYELHARVYADGNLVAKTSFDLY